MEEEEKIVLVVDDRERVANSSPRDIKNLIAKEIDQIDHLGFTSERKSLKAPSCPLDPLILCIIRRIDNF